MPAVNLQLEQLVDLVGVAAALRLVEKRGGTHFYVPHPTRVKPHALLAQEIGLEAARALAAAYPSQHVMAPRGEAYLRRQRDLGVLNDCKDMSVTAVARKYELTERHVYRIMERGLEGLPEVPGVNDAQGDLFSENAA
jgi:Mor family transcriptional regulator